MLHRAASFAAACAALCIGSGLVGACAEEAIEPVGEAVTTYAGAIDGTDAVFAVSVSEGDAILYVCGGSSNIERSRWYKGALDGNGRAELVASDGSTASLSLLDDRVTGEVAEAGGGLLDLDGVSLEPGTTAGLYSVVDDGCRTGVVVRPGDASGAPIVQGTWCSDEGIFEQVTPIRIEDVSKEIEIEVTVEKPAKTKRLVARFVDPTEL